MLDAATALGRSGFQDWIIQRVSAIIMTIYVIMLLSFWIYVPDNDVLQWQILLTNSYIKYFTFFALLSLVLHAWVGMWIVTTDYVKPPMLRLITQVIIYLALLTYLAWGVRILWA